jgi:hypothetical protein
MATCGDTASSRLYPPPLTFMRSVLSKGCAARCPSSIACREHRGIFTPKESNVHVHLRTEGGQISGHLETIRLAPGARVAVPAPGWRQ